MSKIPVITIDGEAGAGKGTAAQQLSKALGFHYLDSGSLYRAAAWGIAHTGMNPDDEAAVTELLSNLPIRFSLDVSEDDPVPYRLFYDKQDITKDIRSEACGELASQISSKPHVRAALLSLQERFVDAPGLVTDGRDMGTVVFPDACVKFFFTADPVERANRRHKQLIEAGIDDSLPHVLEEINARDHRDKTRAISPLRPADDARCIDTTHMSVEAVMAELLSVVREHI